ncbi:DoxX family membrane protein [Flavobacterium amnicola]|uniref:DoxX family membrane protein n=1 Tax=Flavobacterium amnicola TaxID=2506422 RepID=A0A4Q1K1W3_9FLAO|nr:DoxX family membrane protein [Flavobacterium amnicola]RXR18297.1 DoxX family membrane protein [Flavobacterium amnicola]
MKTIKILIILLNLFVGGFMIYGGIGKFTKPIPKPNAVIEQVQKGEEIAPNAEVLVIKNYIFGMKQTNYFWQFLGFAELFAGVLLLSQFFARIGAIIALPLTLNIFLFHLFLEFEELGELGLTFGLFAANVALIAFTYRIWKPLLIDKQALKLVSVTDK